MEILDGQAIDHSLVGDAGLARIGLIPTGKRLDFVQNIAGSSKPLETVALFDDEFGPGSQPISTTMLRRGVEIPVSYQIKATEEGGSLVLARYVDELDCLVRSVDALYRGHGSRLNRGTARSYIETPAGNLYGESHVFRLIYGRDPIESAALPLSEDDKAKFAGALALHA